MNALEKMRARLDEINFIIDEISTKINTCSKDSKKLSCGSLMAERNNLVLESTELKKKIRKEERTPIRE